ncbi:MAG TPA: PhnA domain-containing protein [Chitinophagales bacterium]|nr:PhnA domain-containing protein [Chitinophagales bacterium]HMX04363.1 PhnA domain-containing protein [Chitinophagales bacterium]HMZ88315.1 PhnA domain-containing protein [Chitinophagales bacterium]HNA57691.1 PhnA domain-containing protein [Chitinophagales bacterium]HNE47196.1 PhnA domain-containing protein [Chitinophagales bacterium]
MSISITLQTRCAGVCELCGAEPAVIEITVSPKDESTENQVAICTVCETALANADEKNHWQCLSGSIWSTEPAVQALSYRILYGIRDESWAAEILDSGAADESVINWAMKAYEVADVHQDAYGNVLANGDNVILTQALKIKGTSFSAPKGTQVRSIHLVHDNTEQIEGKINGTMIVILTKFVKKG